MKLNHNSTSARLYRWFYITDEMPQTLCPYFWKLVIMWIFLAPVGLISIPIVITKQEADEWPVRILGGLLLWGIVALLFIAIFPITYLFWGWFDPKTTFGAWQRTGLALWGMLIVGSIIWGILEIRQRKKEARRHRQKEWIWNDEGDYVKNPDYEPYEEKPSIIIEFIKAKYNKYCPKIDWTK